ncbi:MAG: type 4a pilus biogenesis protein PilO [Deltaproteobacteria bacterium]|nr:type 4a pilus biogenesis protein PilO [Deltaproteobacteria bacterium]
MNELLDRLLDRPAYQKLMLLGSAIFLILLVYYISFYSPRADQIADLAAHVENSRTERDKKQRLAANLPKLKDQLQLLNGMLKEAIAQLPDRKEIPDLLSSISTKVTESGLEILLFRPRAEQFQDFYAEVPVDIIVKGSFHNLVTFFDEVGRLERLININNIDVKSPKGAGDQVVVEGSTLLTTFRFLDEAERAKIAAEKAAKEKAAKK